MTTPISPQDLIKNLKKNIYHPVYFLQGSESYYIDKIVAYIETHVLTQEERTLNLSIFYGEETCMESILLQAKKYPIIGNKQVVIIKEAQKLQALRKTSSQTLLLNYLKHPNEYTILVFAHKCKPLDQNSLFTKALLKNALVVNSNSLNQNQVLTWIKNYLKKEDYNITSNATKLLYNMVGNNLQQLASELDKLTMNLTKQVTIDVKHIEQLTTVMKETKIFDLQDAIAGKNTKKAHKISEHLTQNLSKYPFSLIISILTTFFSKLLYQSYKPLTTTFTSPYISQTHLKASQQYPIAQTIANIHHLHQADLQSKNIGYLNMEQKIILQELIVKLTLPTSMFLPCSANNFLPLLTQKSLFSF